MVEDKVYGRGHLVKDVMTENSRMSWQQVVNGTLGRTWMGKLHVDALARVHDVVLTTPHMLFYASHPTPHLIFYASHTLARASLCTVCRRMQRFVILF